MNWLFTYSFKYKHQLINIFYTFQVKSDQHLHQENQNEQQVCANEKHV